VAENLGQVGIAYDKFDVRGAESREADRPGCRTVGGGIATAVAGKQCKQGPTVAMLDYYYYTVLWDAGDLDDGWGALHDCSGANGEQSCDAGLLNSWLDLAAPGNEKALLAMGDGVAEDLALSGTPSMSALAGRLGVQFVADSYFAASGNRLGSAAFKPLDADPGSRDPFHSTRRYGFVNSCLDLLDVVDRDAAVAGAERAARYEDFGDRGTPGSARGPTTPRSIAGWTRPSAATSAPCSTASRWTGWAAGTGGATRPCRSTR